MPSSPSIRNSYKAGRLVSRSAAAAQSGHNFPSMVVALILFRYFRGKWKAQPAKYVPIVVFYPPAVGHDDCPFPTVMQFTRALRDNN